MMGLMSGRLRASSNASESQPVPGLSSSSPAPFRASTPRSRRSGLVWSTSSGPALEAGDGRRETGHTPCHSPSTQHLVCRFWLTKTSLIQAADLPVKQRTRSKTIPWWSSPIREMVRPSSK